MLYSRIVAVAALATTISTLPLNSRTIVVPPDFVTIPVGDVTKRNLALDLANNRNYYSRRDDPIEVEPPNPDDPEISPSFVESAISLHSGIFHEIDHKNKTHGGNETDHGNENGSLNSRTIVAAPDFVTIPVGDVTKRDLALDLANNRKYHSRRDDSVEIEPPNPDDPEISPSIVGTAITLHNDIFPGIVLEDGTDGGDETDDGNENGNGDGDEDADYNHETKYI